MHLCDMSHVTCDMGLVTCDVWSVRRQHESRGCSKVGARGVCQVSERARAGRRAQWDGCFYLVSLENTFSSAWSLACCFLLPFIWFLVSSRFLYLVSCFRLSWGGEAWEKSGSRQVAIERWQPRCASRLATRKGGWGVVRGGKGPGMSRLLHRL